jgi:hypothetical protein
VAGGMIVPVRWPDRHRGPRAGDRPCSAAISWPMPHGLSCVMSEVAAEGLELPEDLA